MAGQPSRFGRFRKGRTDSDQGIVAAKERKERKDHPFSLRFFAIYAFFRGYTSG